MSAPNRRREAVDAIARELVDTAENLAALVGKPSAATYSELHALFQEYSARFQEALHAPPQEVTR
jgi:hypothetical protein